MAYLIQNRCVINHSPVNFYMTRLALSLYISLLSVYKQKNKVIYQFIQDIMWINKYLNLIGREHARDRPVQD